MSENTILWVLGAIVTIGLAGGGLYNSIIQRLVRLEVEITNTKATFEGIRTMLEGIGDRAIKMGHYDDDRLGLDKLVEKYEERNGELTPQEWQQIQDAYEAILNDGTKDMNDRINANIAASFAAMKLSLAFSKHKLKGFGGIKLK